MSLQLETNNYTALKAELVLNLSKSKWHGI